MLILPDHLLKNDPLVGVAVKFTFSLHVYICLSGVIFIVPCPIIFVVNVFVVVLLSSNAILDAVLKK